MGTTKAVDINNVVVVSDTHCGCQLGLCPSDGVKLDEGGGYKPSALQQKVWKMWETFWGEFVPWATRNEPYCVVFNGDSIDGKHHDSVTQISHNLADQSEIAYRVLSPVVERCEGRYFHIRGTEAHVGKSAQEEEALAKRLGAIPNDEGQFARYELWKSIGDNRLVHFLHHIGTTGSQAYEATAVGKELIESFVEAARYGQRPPDVICRSHRHRCIKISIPTQQQGERSITGEAIAVVTPGWQLKTPFAWKIPGARLSLPQLGGVVIRWAHEELFVRTKVWTVERSRVA